MLELKSISKSFHDGESELLVLDGIDLTLKPGESLALLGASGNGKSTLLQIAAGLEDPDAGSVQVLGQDLSTLNESGLALMRRKHLGFVFQQFNLLPGLNVRNNILFQRRLNGLGDRDAWIDELTGVLELAPLLNRPVEVLSGGQQQRVAIARALAHQPKLVFADEPTGNLHDTLSRQVMKLMARLVEESGCSLLLVTHNRAMAEFANRRLLLEEGHLHALR
ncbi:MAG: ABC transporter ATP-binding protein [Xanthomonadales bacterium]|nr:ABC transporter ATP-binding protein [Gammaproteobacteria bacterium]MBT8054314.1 ABC transporter ATP-binding protein [Gammaproteobacteria bacterium]NND57493.1 ABC transporter ATP-binding protein [Xanthomonadales bacterium]NNK51217.1 ABC transporter ATP-binding protein [Xanthomonadales bacterium]